MDRVPVVPGLRWWQAPSAALARPRLAQAERPAPAAASARIHWPRTLASKGTAPLQHAHLQRVHTPAKPTTLHLIALDNSGSMRYGARLAQAKAFASRLLEEATRAGTHVAVLLFGGQGVQWLQHATPARRSAMPRIGRLGGGGGTPLAEGLRQAQTELQTFRRRHGSVSCTLWLLTDGRSLEHPHPPAGADHLVIVDFDDPQRPLGRCRDWAVCWGAEWRRPLAAAS